MKNHHIFLFWVGLLIFPNLLFAQKLTFNYDASGNQNERKWVCINCIPGSSNVNEKQANNLQNLEDGQGLITKKSLKVYPNPISEVLTVSWELPEKNYVQDMQVFSVGGNRVYNSTVSPNQREAQISFNKLPPGTYILLIKYGDNSTESVKLIKI